MSASKSFPPTKRRLERARREGKVLKSPLITQYFCMVSVVAGLLVLLRSTWVSHRMLLEYLWTEGFADLERVGNALAGAAGQFLGLTLALLGVVTILVESVQGGICFQLAHLARKNSPFDFFSNLSKVLNGLRESWEVALRLAVLGVVFCWFFRELVRTWPAQLIAANAHVSLVAGLLRPFAWCTVGALLGLGGIDYWQRRRKYYRELMMSFDEMKEEFRQDEGDPHVRGARKHLHRELSMSEVVSRIRKAKVVVVERTKE